MTKFLSVAVFGVGAGATIFAAPHASREGGAHDSSSAGPTASVAVAVTRAAAPGDAAVFATVTGRVTLLASDTRTARDVANAVVYLEPVAPRPTPPAPASRPVTDAAASAARETPRMPGPGAAPRDTVRLLWAAVQELRQTVSELREALRLLRVQLAGGTVPPDAPTRADTTAAPPGGAAAAAAASGGAQPTGAQPTGAQPAGAAPGAQIVRPAPARVIPTVAIAMRQKEFIPHVRIVEVGGAVEYPNRDPFSHNVFSSTPGGAFDLGLYPRGESRAAVFRRPGAYSIFCNIHAKMSAFVVAVPTPHFAHPQADGRFSIDGVPPGRYRLHVWHERAPEQSMLVTVADRGASGIEVTLDARTYRPAAHLNKFGQPYPVASRDDY